VGARRSGPTLRWGVSKAALLYRGRRLASSATTRSAPGYITLNRHGKAIEDTEDASMPIEVPEVVTEGLDMMKTTRRALVAVACKMHVQPRLLDDLLGRASHRSAEVVNLLPRPDCWARRPSNRVPLPVAPGGDMRVQQDACR
jgi:hypothetical protein